MDLYHYIRSHLKDSKRVWDDMSDKSDKLAEIKKDIGGLVARRIKLKTPILGRRNF